MNKISPKVSIVIPVFNGSNYLQEAIESAINQDYKNIEIIVINDGSNDNGATKNIALSFGNKIKYYEKENGGVSSALNLGVKKMDGDYFSWLSHDDRYKENKISTQIDFLISNNGQFITYTGYDLINHNSKFIDRLKLDPDLLERKALYAIFRAYINGCTLLLPKECFNLVGYFDETLKYTQDYDFWFKLSKHYQFIHIKKFLVETRIHSEQDSNKIGKFIPECNQLWSKMIENLSIDQISEMEETKLKFLIGMSEFLKSTPYNGALSFVEKEIIKLNRLYINLNPLVTIVIHFYNNISNTIRAIKSVVEQSYTNWELILVNDGSTEDLLNIISYVESNDKIRLYTNANNEIKHSRNIGIKYANGDYIAFLDSNDQFDSKKIQKQLSNMINNGSYLSHTSFTMIIDNKKTYFNSGTFKGVVFPEIIKFCPIHSSTVMIHSSLLEKNKFFNEEINYGEDICAWIKLSSRFDFVAIDESLTNVYLSASKVYCNYNKRLQALENIIEYVKNTKFMSNKYEQIGHLMKKSCTYNRYLNENKIITNQFIFNEQFRQNNYLIYYNKIIKALNLRLNYIINRFKFSNLNIHSLKFIK
jgi:glycosyltransferase involved in cell wall biosynthesis